MNKYRTLKHYKNKNINDIQKHFNIDFSVDVIQEFKKKQKNIKIKIFSNFHEYFTEIYNTLKINKKEFKMIPKIIKKKIKYCIKKSKNKKHIYINYPTIKGFKFFFNQFYNNLKMTIQEQQKEINKKFILIKWILSFLFKRKMKKILKAVKKLTNFFNNL